MKGDWKESASAVAVPAHDIFSSKVKRGEDGRGRKGRGGEGGEGGGGVEWRRGEGREGR